MRYLERCYVNLRKLCYCCCFFFRFLCCFLLFFSLTAFYRVMMNKNVYKFKSTPHVGLLDESQVVTHCNGRRLSVALTISVTRLWTRPVSPRR